MSSARSTRTQRSALVLLATCLVAVLAVTSAPHADAASYRFWGYFQLKGNSWAFSPKGAAQVTPADGSVEGWRFAVAAPTDSRTPRGVVTFAAACGDTPARDGMKRVGVVIDFGRSADAESGNPPSPTARCAQVPTNATGAQVLAAVAPVRNEKGLLCAVASWPAAGCGGEVDTVSAAAAAKDQPVSIAVARTEGSTDAATSTSPLLWGAVALVVLALLAALVVAARRRQQVETA